VTPRGRESVAKATPCWERAQAHVIGRVGAEHWAILPIKGETLPATKTRSQEKMLTDETAVTSRKVRIWQKGRVYTVEERWNDGPRIVQAALPIGRRSASRDLSSTPPTGW
jgi:hypothetical protein